jgi:hypothetical protein
MRLRSTTKEEQVRRLTGIAVTVAAALVCPSAASATPPHNGCPNGFTLAPVSVLPASFTGTADNVNHDGQICLKTLANGSHTVVDNTTP